MSVLTEKSTRDGVIIAIAVSGENVLVSATRPGGSTWNLGYFRQDADGNLYFERSAGLSSSVGYPKVLLEPNTTKIRVT